MADYACRKSLIPRDAAVGSDGHSSVTMKLDRWGWQVDAAKLRFDHCIEQQARLNIRHDVPLGIFLTIGRRRDIQNAFNIRNRCVDSLRPRPKIEILRIVVSTRVCGVDHGMVGRDHPFAGADAGGDVGQGEQAHLLRREARALRDPVVDAMAFGIRQGSVGLDFRAAQLHVLDMQESAARAFADRHFMLCGAPRYGERASLRRMGDAVAGQE